MTNLPAVATFAYDALVAGDAAHVRLATERLRAAITSTARLVVRIGLQLAAVRRRLKPYRGAWEAYLRAEVPWSRGQVYRLMRASRAFRRVEEVDRFQPTALYVLTWPDAPAGATRAALALARDGHRIDATLARQLVAEHRPVPPMPATGDAPPSEEVEAEEPPADDDGGACARLMALALARFSTLHIMQPEDDDRIGITGYPKDEGGTIANKWGKTLTAALEGLLGLATETKWCGTCEAEKPLGQYCRHAGEPDGLNRYCRDCARAFREKQKAKKGPRVRRKRQRPVV